MAKFYYGGQAVIEGVMMRGRTAMATAVRREDGEIVVNRQPLTGIYTGKARQTPITRGIIVLIESLVLGMGCLLFSTSVTLSEGEGEDKKELPKWVLWLVMAFSMGLSVLLFFLAPLFLTRLLHIQSPILFNLTDGIIRTIILLGYLKIVGFMPEVGRVFAYHGAEHKTINAYEHGAMLDVESVKKYSTAHMRCSTSFIFVVLIISVIVFSLTGLHGVWWMVFSRLVLIPLIAAVSYEVIYFGGRHAENKWVRAILTPGLWLQALTTRQPDDKQLEVAITALKNVMEADEAVPVVPDLVAIPQPAS